MPGKRVPLRAGPAKTGAVAAALAGENACRCQVLHGGKAVSCCESRLIALLLACILGAASGWADDMRAPDELERLTGARTRVVWIEGTSSAGDLYARDDQMRLMGMDTRDGRGARPIIAAPGRFHRPIFTPDGAHIIFSDLVGQRIEMVAWDGSGRRELGRGLALTVWRDPLERRDWLYIQAGEKTVDAQALARAGGPWELLKDLPVQRVRLDEPSTREMVWNRTPITVTPNMNFQVSADGRRACGAFPWNRCGVAHLAEGTWREYGRGCWTSLAPDNSYRCWIFQGNHREIELLSSGGAARTTVDLSMASGTGSPVYHPRWSNHVRILSLTQKCSDLYVGRFSEDYTRVESWVRVTNGRRTFYPDVWIEGRDAWARTNTPTHPIPSPWQHAEVGSRMGDAHVNTEGRFVLLNQGRDIHGTSDTFHFLYQTATGDCEVAAFVVAVQNPGRNGRYGVMFREGGEAALTAGAPHVQTSLRPDGRVCFTYRASENAPCMEVAGRMTVPAWVKLVRRGNRFTGYVSANGLDWRRVHEATCPLGPVTAAGAVFCSSDDGGMGAGVFEAIGIGKPPRRLVVEATLETVGTPPDPEQIVPYRRALVPDVYAVQTVLDGCEPSARIVVASWGVLEGKLATNRTGAVGERRRLRLLRFDDIPRLRSEYLNLPEGELSLPLYCHESGE